MIIDTSAWQCGPNLLGDSEEDTHLLRAMYKECLGYIESFKWAPPIKTLCLGFGVGGVIAVFLVEFAYPVNEHDGQLWIIVGDLPSAYFVTDDAPTVDGALRIYCEMMTEWAKAVMSDEQLNEKFPVDAPATKENARQLLSRIAFIRRSILPAVRVGTHRPA